MSMCVEVGSWGMRETDSCNTDPTSLQSMSAQAWGERFWVLCRISYRVGRIEEALRSRSSLSDFCILPYFSFQEWYAWRTGRCSSER